jgi:phosphatidylserine synthase
MFDIQLQFLKDGAFLPLRGFVLNRISPPHITFLGFCCGLTSCYASFRSRVLISFISWVLNRALDCLDGAVVRQRNIASQLGGFLDLLADFIVYSLIPVAIAAGQEGKTEVWLAVAIL